MIQRSSLLLSNSFAALAGPVKGSGKGGGGGDEKKGGGDEKKGGGDEKKAPAKSAPKETELQRKGRTWEGYYDNAIHQMNGHGADAMNHNVDQQSVLNHLPAVGAGNHYYAVRAAPGDNQIRIFLEVDASNNVVAGGQVLIGRCLTHQQSRDAGAFWVYRRTGLRTWVHHSGTQPY